MARRRKLLLSRGLRIGAFMRSEINFCWLVCGVEMNLLTGLQICLSESSRTEE